MATRWSTRDYKLKDKKQHVAENVHCERSTCKSVLTRPYSTSFHKPISPDGSLYSNMSKDVCFKSTQTVETAFVPCESCSIIQRSFKKCAFAIFKTCQKLNLPSNVNKLILKPDIYDCWMSFNEITKYSYEQDKDLSVICRHIETLVAETEPRKTAMELLETKYKSLENQQKAVEKKLALEKETNIVLQKQHQTKFKVICGLKDKLEHQIITIEDQLVTCRENLMTEQQKTQDFKLVKAQLVEELRKQTEAAKDREKFLEEVNRLSLQSNEYSEKLVELAKELAREQAKSKSMLKHTESMEKKQNSLLERVEQLSEDNSALRDQLADLQDETDENLQKYDELLKEKVNLQQQLKDEQIRYQQLRDEKNGTKKLLKEVRLKVEELSEELKKTHERETLLVQYPDLNGPVLDDNLYSGHLEKDMDLQLKSNVVRIELLGRQNLVLRNTLEKIGSNSTISQNVKVQPIPLWDSKKTNNDIEGSCHDNDIEGSCHDSDNQCFSSRSVTRIKHNQQQYHQKNKEKYSHMNNKEENRGSIVRTLFNAEIIDDYRLISKQTSKNIQAGIRPRSSNSSRSGQIQQLQPTKKSSSSIQTNKYLEQLGKMHHGNPRSKTTVSDKSGITIKSLPTGSTVLNTFVCKHCDKLYLLERELSIHYLYCKG